MDGKFLPLRTINICWSSSCYFSVGIVKISTEIFIKYVVLNSVNVLYVGIKAYANKYTNQDAEVKWRIIISKLSMSKLIYLVCPYFIPELLYK